MKKRAPTASPDPLSWQHRMTQLLTRLTTGEGVRPTSLDGLRLMRVDRPLPRLPVLYEPCIVIVAQGRKRGYLGGKVYTYDPHHYLVLSVPLPFECETQVAKDGPMLAMKVRIDLAVVGELLMKMNHLPPVESRDGPSGIFATPVDDSLGEVAVRLLGCLDSPADIEVLGSQYIRELTYRVLCGKRGGALRALIAVSGQVAQIQRALRWMHLKYADAIDIPSLAAESAMSASAFHHHFKEVTATSPLQYLKSLRLHQARLLMVHQQLSAGIAADRVGYKSASQFSREFKRFFGSSPLQEAARVRLMLGLDAAPGGGALISEE